MNPEKNAQRNQPSSEKEFFSGVPQLPEGIPATQGSGGVQLSPETDRKLGEKLEAEKQTEIEQTQDVVRERWRQAIVSSVILYTFVILIFGFVAFCIFRSILSVTIGIVIGALLTALMCLTPLLKFILKFLHPKKINPTSL